MLKNDKIHHYLGVTMFKISLVFFLFLLSTITHAEPLQKWNCINKSKHTSYDISAYTLEAAGSRLQLEFAITEFSINPDSTARIAYEADKALYGDILIFDTNAQALAYVKKNIVRLYGNNYEELSLNVKKNTLTQKVSNTVLKCKNY